MSDVWTNRLSEYLDDELQPAERLELERHLLDCASCRDVLDSLRALAARVAALEDAPPARDLWPGIEAAVRGPRRARWHVTLTLPQAIAASALLAVVSGLTVWTFVGRPESSQIAAIPMPEPAPAVRVVPASDAQYDRAVTDLMRVLTSNRQKLNPRTIAVIERNLATIDHAIAEARAAIAQDPGDVFLQAHLVEQRRLKLALLRQAGTIVQQGN